MKRLLILLLLSGCQDWDNCEPTDITRERHTDRWVQIHPSYKVGDVTIPMRTQIHPARDWTERQWICHNENESVYRWREIEQ